MTSREKEVADRLERGKEVQQEKLAMSRTSSRAGAERNAGDRSATPPTASSSGHSPTSSKPLGPNLAPTVRPTLSFANAAKKDAATKKPDGGPDENSVLRADATAANVTL